MVRAFEIAGVTDRQRDKQDEVFKCLLLGLTQSFKFSHYLGRERAYIIFAGIRVCIHDCIGNPMRLPRRLGTKLSRTG